MSLSPTVLHPLTLPGLLHYTLATQSGTAPTTLVVCSSRDSFLQDLVAALQHEQQTEHGTSKLEPLTTPTLFHLFTAQHVKLAFCPSVPALLAYLTAWGRRPRTEAVGGARGRARERLLLVNPLAMHAPTTSFSAQGLSRTFAAATEAALGSGAVLNMVECHAKQRPSGGHEDAEADTVAGAEQGRTEAEAKDGWDQDVSILNLSVRRYGSGSSDRAWAGRTVTARRVAGRWFHFQKMEG